MPGNERRNKKSLQTTKVFGRCLKTGSDGAEVMSDGNSFHKSAPPTGNDRLPMVLLRRMNGVVRWLVHRGP